MTSPLILEQDFSVSYTYTRSTGPIIGAFLTALRDDKKILGIKTSDGQIIVPPVEFDPNTTEMLSELVEVGQRGTVSAFCWVKEPIAHHPLQKPFAWAMIRLEGADTDMIHMVDSGLESAIEVGMQVKAEWAEQRVGNMNDIRCFVPVEDTP